MKTLILLAAMALGSATASAQKLETRNINGFASVNVQDGIEVHFTQGPTESVTVEYGAGAVASDLVTDCYGTELKIYRKDHPTGSAAAIKVYVTQKTLRNITVGSGASFAITGRLEAEDIKVTLGTGGRLEGILSCTGTCSLKAYTGSVALANITAARFKGDITGGATVKLEGSTRDADIFCSAGTLLAGKFAAVKADITAKRTSAVLINIQDTVKADADESSAITYYGKPQNIKVAEGSYAVKRS